MKKTPSPEDPDKPFEEILGSRLRSTSPEFEQRFDNLRRQLANEEPVSVWLRWWEAFRQPEARGIRIASATAVVILVVTIVALNFSPYSSPEHPDNSVYIELVALEESLSSALVLSDAETLDAIINMPVN